jgi:hypothetical protein
VHIPQLWHWLRIRRPFGLNRYGRHSQLMPVLQQRRLSARHRPLRMLRWVHGRCVLSVYEWVLATEALARASTCQARCRAARMVCATETRRAWTVVDRTVWNVLQLIVQTEVVNYCSWCWWLRCCGRGSCGWTCTVGVSTVNAKRLLCF